MFLISNKLEQLEFKLEKKMGLRNMQEKLENTLDSNKYPIKNKIYVMLEKTRHLHSEGFPILCYSEARV